MTAVLLGGQTDPMRRSATARDGALALLTGLAANRSLETAAPVRVADLLDQSAGPAPGSPARRAGKALPRH
jgi:hypothetical protein